MKPNFLIAAPPYSHQSGGIMVLHNLCHELNGLGYNAAIAFFHSGSSDKQDYKWSITNMPELYQPGGRWVGLDVEQPGVAIREFLENGIAVYPDIVTGNPLNAKHIVRYVLGANDRAWGDDYVLAFSHLYCQHHHAVLFSSFENPAIHDRDSLPWYLRKMDATYIGKGAGLLPCHRIPGTILIERDWPRDKEQLGLLLRQVRYLFSWDCLSATNLDAIQSGCVPVLMHDLQVPRQRLAEGELGPYPSVELLDTTDPTSVKLDPAVVSGQMSAFQHKFRYWANNWGAQVKAFAEHCSDYFHLKA